MMVKTLHMATTADEQLKQLKNALVQTSSPSTLDECIVHTSMQEQPHAEHAVLPTCMTSWNRLGRLQWLDGNESLETVVASCAKL